MSTPFDKSRAGLFCRRLPSTRLVNFAPFPRVNPFADTFSPAIKLLRTP